MIHQCKRSGQSVYQDDDNPTQLTINQDTFSDYHAGVKDISYDPIQGGSFYTTPANAFGIFYDYILSVPSEAMGSRLSKLVLYTVAAASNQYGYQ